MLRLDSGVQFVKGVGPRRASLLASRGIRTVNDLLMHVPRIYQDRVRFTPFEALRIGENATLSATVYQSRLVQTRSRTRILEVALTDGSTYAYAKWFHGEHLHRNHVFTPGRRVILFGKVEFDTYNRKPTLYNPEYECLDDDESPVSSATGGRLVPVYEEAAGITSRQFRRIMEACLADLAPDIPDSLPAEIRSKLGLPDLRTCLNRIHLPSLDDSIDALNARESAYHRRLAFEEFFLMELIFALRRAQCRSADGVRFETHERIREQIKRMLPFHPTAAQKRVLKEIVDDLKAPHPMNRLLQGDVGSGKTIVAFESIVVAVENGYQAVLMAPTEILAEQHYLNACRLLTPLDYRIGIVRHGLRKAEKAESLQRIAAGETQLVIGTHALIENDTAFHRLGLVIVDEQHRFGVMQRLRLMAKGENPNTLVMTATPIPRTLAMTLYGDLDLSVIDEMPPGRSPIRTMHIRERERHRVTAEMDQAIAEGRQSYVVFPIIEDSEKVDLKSATEGVQRLQQELPHRRIALLHGRMKSDDKDATMRAFTKGEIDVLVSTTVIEVGVDVPNATFMLVEHAERFGLAQLHQLRGRVGRGAHQSTCMLMTPNGIGDIAEQRIRAMVSTTDGFKLAEVDLQLRGPGELTGTRQSGMPELRIADLMRDARLLALAQEEARAWVDRNEDREHLIASLSERLRGSSAVGLATVG